MKTVCAIVVTYNRKELLCRCLDAILSQTYPVSGIVVIDNNSDDGTGDRLRDGGYRDNGKVEYHRLGNNTGGAGGFHAGLRRVVKSDAQFAWIMDDDVIPEPDALMELIKARGRIDGPAGFIASAVRGEKGEALNVPKINRSQFLRYTDWYRYLEYGMVQVVKATFVSLLIDTDAVRAAGLPWKDFFIWGDDSEYTQRLIRYYGPAYMAGSSKVTHLRGSRNELSIVTEEDPSRIPLYFYYYRNNLIVFHEYESLPYRFLCLGKLFYDGLRVILSGKFKQAKLKIMTKALLNYVFGLYDKRSFRNRMKFSE